jgi:hypothetical protein
VPKLGLGGVVPAAACAPPACGRTLPDEDRKSTLKELDGNIRAALENVRFAEAYFDKMSAARDLDIAESALQRVAVERGLDVGTSVRRDR